VAAIRARRTAGGVRFLVTGATGFLGAHIARSLLACGHRVVALVRHGRDEPAAERFRRVLDWLAVGPADAARATVVAGDVAEERFGLPPEAWQALAGGVDEVVHCAAVTSFAGRHHAALERVNVGGTAAAIACAAAGGASSFHLVSSAYAAGSVEGPVDGEWREQAAFANAYEETKHRAEALARAACMAAGVRLSVYRPAIVYGDSVTGRSLRFNALYYPVKMLLFLRDLHLGASGRGTGTPGTSGIEALPDGRVRLPLRVETHPEGALNLVPVDHFERAFAVLLESAPEGGSFPIVSGDAVPVERVIEYIRRRYRIEGLAAASGDSFAARPRTPLETLYEGYLAPYRPYLRERRRFVAGAAGLHLAAAGARCPRFTFAVFDRAMRYAEQVAWGKRLFPMPGAG
jgi:nucleoside-diphosphate-sugar epimerase